MKSAKFYEIKYKDKIKCGLCPHNCLIAVDKKGICQTRINKGGKLYTENYAQISSIGIDPIEKKPLYHFYPNQDILSIGSYGCNFTCDFCQNWQISQKKPQLKTLYPDDVLKLALKHNVIGLAYTYSEPVIYYEYISELSKLAKEYNLKNVLVTNGYINKEPLQELLPFIDAVNIDLKAFTDDFYHQYCGGELAEVLETIKTLVSAIHVEITTLIIPDLNDQKKDLRRLFSWLKEIKPEIPLHLSRYYPQYKLKIEATPIETMLEAYNLAKEYLKYVYTGNFYYEKGSNTFCPQCKKAIVIRKGYQVETKIKQGKCIYCNHILKDIIK